MSAEGSVTYTVKELIGMLEKTLTDQMGRIIVRLDELDNKLDSKASEIRVSALEDRVKDLEKTVVNLELTRAGSQALTGFGRWVFSGVFAAVLGAIISLVWFALHAH